jgi:hypothetical protein
MVICERDSWAETDAPRDAVPTAAETEATRDTSTSGTWITRVARYEATTAGNTRPLDTPSATERSFEDGAIDTSLDRDLDLLMERSRRAFGMSPDTVQAEEALADFLSVNGEQGLVALAISLASATAQPDVLDTALRSLGRDRFGEWVSAIARVWFMSRFLSHPSPAIRDSAIVGLIVLDHPSATSPLERAAATEPIPELGEEIRRAIAYLR